MRRRSIEWHQRSSPYDSLARSLPRVGTWGGISPPCLIQRSAIGITPESGTSSQSGSCSCEGRQCWGGFPLGAAGGSGSSVLFGRGADPVGGLRGAVSKLAVASGKRRTIPSAGQPGDGVRVPGWKPSSVSRLPGAAVARDCRGATAGAGEAEAAAEAKPLGAAVRSSLEAGLSELVTDPRRTKSGGNDGRWRANSRLPTAVGKRWRVSHIPTARRRFPSPRKNQKQWAVEKWK